MASSHSGVGGGATEPSSRLSLAPPRLRRRARQGVCGKGEGTAPQKQSQSCQRRAQVVSAAEVACSWSSASAGAQPSPVLLLRADPNRGHAACACALRSSLTAQHTAPHWRRPPQRGGSAAGAGEATSAAPGSGKGAEGGGDEFGSDGLGGDAGGDEGEGVDDFTSSEGEGEIDSEEDTMFACDGFKNSWEQSGISRKGSPRARANRKVQDEIAEHSDEETAGTRRERPGDADGVGLLGASLNHGSVPIDIPKPRAPADEPSGSLKSSLVAAEMRAPTPKESAVGSLREQALRSRAGSIGAAVAARSGLQARLGSSPGSPPRSIDFNLKTKNQA